MIVHFHKIFLEKEMAENMENEESRPKVGITEL